MSLAEDGDCPFEKPDAFELVAPSIRSKSSKDIAVAAELRPRLAEFAGKWQDARLGERSAAHQHFADLCDLLGVPKPADADRSGDRYTFEKNVLKTGGGAGFADVWLEDHFAWEYKGRGKSLSDAYRQLLLYREDLQNPPLLVVCDLNRFEVHTNFTGTVKSVYAFDLGDLVRNEPTPACALRPLEVLRALWLAPESLRPRRTTAEVTREAAAELGKVAEALRRRGADPHEAARFLIRLLFCLFAEDVGLLPDQCFTKLVRATRNRPEVFRERVADLFRCMATGGWFGEHEIRHFNGGLFADDTALELTGADLAIIQSAAALGWESLEPSVLGTLFERGLDPAKRSQLGAHYTSREDILAIVEPVLMAPLRRDWEAVKAQGQALLDERFALMRTDNARPKTAKEIQAAHRIDAKLRKLLADFCGRLRAVRVLDPAAGSGNFLYVSLRVLLDLEKQAIAFAIAAGVGGFFHEVSPEQMRGVEVNEYAHELASVTVWIGYIQWLRENGAGLPSEPILRRLELLRHGDALLTRGDDGQPAEAEWPESDVIVGNPPFVGDKKMRRELGADYVAHLRSVYGERVPGGADLVCYWFEKARALVAEGKVRRAGLLATNSIRKGASRQVLERIKESGDIFMAWGDRPWVQDGADVRVSMVGFDAGAEAERTLDGLPASAIHADLTGGAADLTGAAPLTENQGIAFLGMMKAGPFDIDAATAQRMLGAPLNPNGRPNADVVKRRLGGKDVVRRPQDGWVIDFGTDMTEDTASLYELPFEYVRRHVKPLRDQNPRPRTRRLWWIHGEARPGLRRALADKDRCIVTPEVAKHRLFVWMPTETVPDHSCHVIARDDDYFLGVLHSRAHELWSLAVGNYMGVGNDPRYNSSRTLGTFPFPYPPGHEPADDPKVITVAGAARELVRLRDYWLNPPDAAPAELKKRTLTSLYNLRPAWLDRAHQRLDMAVFAAYGWPEVNLTDEEILSRLLVLNGQRLSIQANQATYDAQ